MKRYDLGKNAEQFGQKQFWVVRCGRYHVWVSYNTAVAIVDNQTHEVILGKLARGFSRTTSKQVTQACYTFARGYDIINYNSVRYWEFTNTHKLNDEKWGVEWDKCDYAMRCVYEVEHF